MKPKLSKKFKKALRRSYKFLNNGYSVADSFARHEKEVIEAIESLSLEELDGAEVKGCVSLEWDSDPTWYSDAIYPYRMLIEALDIDVEDIENWEEYVMYRKTLACLRKTLTTQRK